MLINEIYAHKNLKEVMKRKDLDYRVILYFMIFRQIPLGSIEQTQH